MKSLPKRSGAEFRRGLTLALADAAPKPELRPDDTTSLDIGYVYESAMKQRGMVLFFALIALVVMSLAAVALIRSVDTSTIIAGNLAFRQAATSSGDAGLESAIASMAALETVLAAADAKVYLDPNHPLNKTGGSIVSGAIIPAVCAGAGCPSGGACCQNPGYYSNADPALSLTDGTGVQWDDSDSALVGTDSSDNEIRYVIQRMCREPNTVLSTTNCLFSSPALDYNMKTIPVPSTICIPPPPPAANGCPVAGQAPLYRITAKVAGPRNTVSYIQSFVY